MVISKKMIGIFRTVEDPYGKFAKLVIKYTPPDEKDKEKEVHNPNVYAYTYLEERDEEEREAFQLPEVKKKKKKVPAKKKVIYKFTPYKLQPLYYIYEEVSEHRGKTTIMAEAKFAKYVDNYEWKTYPYYDKHIYWIH